MFQQLLAIAHNTFVESIRQPVYVVLLLVTAAALVLNVPLAAYTLGSDNTLLVQMSLSMIGLGGLLLAAFTATGVLSREIENRTVLTVVSKPVARPVFVLGKFVGVAGAIGVAYYLLSLVVLLTVRHGVMSTAADHFDGPVILFSVGAAALAALLAAGGNYLYGWVFNSTFIAALVVLETLAMLLVLVVSPEWTVQSPLAEFSGLEVPGGLMGQVCLGLVLVFQAVLVLTAIAVACSTRLGQVMTLVVCIVVFVVGLMSNSLSQYMHQTMGLRPDIGLLDSFQAMLAADAGWVQKLVFGLTKLLYLAAPNLQLLWPADAITGGDALEGGMIAGLTLYSLLWVGVALGLAIAMFQTREVG